MTDPVSRAAALLKEHRASIDRLDAILVYTLAERFKHTQSVGRLKAEHALPPSDPARESQQIERLERLAREADLEKASALRHRRHRFAHAARRSLPGEAGHLQPAAAERQ
jgi:chorismate mutase